MGAGIAVTSGTLNDNSVLSVTSNAIMQTANGVGGGVAFFTNSSFASNYTMTFSGNTANAGGNDYAFTVTSYDYNHDNTADYILLTKSGTPKIFLVDGRTGSITKIAGAVSTGLRSGFTVQEADLLGKGVHELVLSPSRGRSGKVSAVNLQSSSVMWTSTTYVTDGMSVMIVGSNDANRQGANDILRTGIANTTHRKFLHGHDGKLENLENNPQLPPIEPPHPRKIMPKLTRSMKFHR